MSPELYELLRKCLVLGGPLCDDARIVIGKDFPNSVVSFMYPYDMMKDHKWMEHYRLNTSE